MLVSKMGTDLSVSNQSPMNIPSNGTLNGGKSLFQTQNASPANSYVVAANNSNNNYPELPNLKVDSKSIRFSVF